MIKVSGQGRLTADPEVRTSRDRGISMATFSIATNRKGDRENADFFRCIAFGKTSEFIEKYLHKGSAIQIFGRLESNTFDDKNGQKVTKDQIVIDEIEFAIGGGKSDNNQKTAEKPKQESFTTLDSDDDFPF